MEQGEDISRIAFLWASMLPVKSEKTGAVEQVIVGLSQALKKRNHICKIIRTYGPEDRPSEDHYGLLGKIKYNFRRVSSMGKAVSGLRSENFDAVLVWDVTALVAIFLFSPNLRKNVVYTFSSSVWPSFDTSNRNKVWTNAFAFLFSCLLIRTIRKLVVQNDQYYYWFSRSVGSSKIALIPPPLLEFSTVYSHEVDEETSILHRLSNKRIVLFVGRKDRIKGLEDLIHASYILNKRHPGTFAVIMIGPNERWGNVDSPYVSELKDLTKKLGLEGVINFLDAVSRSSLRRFYESCDVFVLPSLMEAFGHVVTEAMSFGKPVVCSDVGGIKLQVKDGVNGFLVRPRNPNLLAEKLEILLENERLRHEMGQAAKDSSSKFSMVATARKYESILVPK